MFYTFMQNNSGGHFTINDGVAEVVIIEAYDVKDANRRAERIGVYFDGVENGHDCECCGDRWHMQYEYGQKDEGTEIPEVYGRTIEEYLDDRWSFGKKVYVYHKDGTKKVYVSSKTT